MFTGIVKGLGTVVAITDRNMFREIIVDIADIAISPSIGASVAISGVCLTMTKIDGANISFEVMKETLDKTTTGTLKIGDKVNIETPLKLGDEFGGHIVLGHVDGVGEIIEKHQDGENTRMRFRVPDSLAENIVDKGSIAIDGISLTVCDPHGDEFDVWLLPLTMKLTTLSARNIGDTVNIETDHGTHPFEIRPWGRFDVLYDGTDCKMKRLTVDAGKRLSYQRHARRTEHWVIISGEADVTLNDVTTRKIAGDTVVIEKLTKHRIANTGAEPVVFTEVQIGDYFGEDDIERFEDDFGRA